METRRLISLAGAALLLCGCPKRQTTSRVVYVAGPPTAASATPEKSAGDLVIEEPTPPEPPEQPVEITPAGSTTTPKTPSRPRRRVVPSESTSETQSPSESTEPAIPTPTLEPRESHQQQAAMRQRVVQSQESVQTRINSIERTQMVNADRRTLDMARTFLAQSRKALESGDLQRAFNLARKSSLLVDALEQKP